MIGVLADDLSGAAEIAGIGWRLGLRSEIVIRGRPNPESELVVYDTESRLCDSREAVRRVSRCANRVKRLGPLWVYKKTDSLLRGHVLEEMKCICAVLNLDRCLLVPANPDAGRIIKAGKYLVHGVPISETDFRYDPFHPRRSSFVKRLLDPTRRHKVMLLRPGTLHFHGIAVGQSETASDLRHWSSIVNAATLPAGGAEFFRAMLHSRASTDYSVRLKTPPSASRTLFVSGSVSMCALEFAERCRQQGWPVFSMPAELITRGNHRAAFELWVRAICGALKGHRYVVVSIGRPVRTGKQESDRLGTLLVKAAQQVLDGTKSTRLCVDGGATAALLLKHLGFTRLTVDYEFAMGVTSVRPVNNQALQIVVKPGSYAWPEDLLA